MSYDADLYNAETELHNAAEAAESGQAALAAEHREIARVWLELAREQAK